jgi:muconolactone D-isomerase
VEFLVQIEFSLPSELGAEGREQLLEREHERALELKAAGTIERIWRVPGRRANVGIWRADDATELHAALASLPLFPWMDIEVSALAQHPVERG